MRKSASFLVLLSVVMIAGCSSNSTPATSGLPPPNSSPAVPAGVTASTGYKISVFAAIPSTSSNPDSLVQDGNHVFVGVGDDLNPDGTPGPSGKTNVEILQYSLSGVLQKTFSVVGHNDGLLAFDSSTLWVMSNEDCNPKLTTLNFKNGSQHVYTPQSSLVTGGCLTSTGGGIDDMQVIGGQVYVSGSNPNPTPAGPCPANSSTPGCPNGVSTYPAVFTLTLNSDGVTFNLTPVLTSGNPATNVATASVGTLNTTDPDSEGQTPDGTTLLLDSQQDSELVFIANPGASQTVSYLPLTLNGALTAIDDTRYAPSKKSFMLFTDTPNNIVYRVDSSFASGSTYSSAPAQVASLSLTTGVLTPIVTGIGHPNGMLFVTAP